MSHVDYLRTVTGKPFLDAIGFSAAVLLAAWALVACGPTTLSADPLVFTSLGNVQLLNDFALGTPSGYQRITHLLLDSGHTILPGTSILPQQAMEDVDVFYFGVSKEGDGITLSDESESILRDFVTTGGTLILETDSTVDQRATANRVLDLFGYGPNLIRGSDLGVGTNGRNAGRFVETPTMLSESPAYDLKGLPFATTTSAHIPNNLLVGRDYAVIGQNQSFNTVVQLRPAGAEGSILFLGDPIFSDPFLTPGSDLYNEHNQMAFENLLYWLGGDVIDPPASVCDLNESGSLDAEDMELLSAAVRRGAADPRFDLNGDGLVDGGDRGFWVEHPSCLNSYFGDANLDGQFNSGDFVFVFTNGEYEDTIPGNSTWADGDWNGDGDFNSGDFVIAFQSGGFEQGPRAGVSAVPEPSSLLLLVLATLAFPARGILGPAAWPAGRVR